MSSGKFFTFEGIDGCGKSTQLKAVAAKLEKDGRRIVVTREPGGTAIAEKIRAIIMSPAHNEMVTECELLLYLAARAQHVHEKIVPALEQGAIVLCDRFQAATFAYQGYGRGLPLDQLRALNAFATGGMKPDMTFIFDISLDLSFKRLKMMNKPVDRMETGPLSFYQRIYDGYQEIAKSTPEEIAIINGDREIGEITEDVYQRIVKIVSKK